jgi:Glycosyl hydrolase family 63 C-terminal domain
MTAEEKRLEQSRTRKMHWKRWGPYVSDRAWGTVREDYSATGEAWDYFPHDHARSRAYRWNEDGLAAICDRHQFVCFGLALWNEKDPILKERLFGLTTSQGNHGEDVKEYYFHLDSTPTHSYMKFLYKYPHGAFPYAQLVKENRRRSKQEPEFELLDTGLFNHNRYFDVEVEYAKASPEDILVRITAHNRGPEPAPIHLLPMIWFRNTWSWQHDYEKPSAAKSEANRHCATIALQHPACGKLWLYCQEPAELLFTENETNTQRLYGTPGPAYAKDGINDHLVAGQADAVNPAQTGTKAAAHYSTLIPPGESLRIQLRLTKDRWPAQKNPLRGDFDGTFALRRREADEFYATVVPHSLSPDGRNVLRQAFAGLLWSKQFYHYVQRDWLAGDPAQPAPPAPRKSGRNSQWSHLYNADVISMPDKWEYPWYAAWDLAFHCVPLALVDPDFDKEQLVLFLREWYMHPNGQLPAYEWALGDVNPPVHAWAAWRVYKIDKKQRGRGDQAFLERVFQKLLLNFTWWVNRKDAEGMNVFEGGFLGLDNIGIFDRSAPLPTSGHIEQSDATAWMAMYTLNMLAIALELASNNPVYEDLASKFWEHFLYIARAMSHRGDGNQSMWNEEDGFFYDVLHLPDDQRVPMKVRSLVGLVPLFAVQTLEPELLDRLPGFKRRLEWFIENRPDLMGNVACMKTPGMRERRLLSVVDPEKLRHVLRYMLDESEFLSPYGVRALSRFHQDHPYTLSVHGMEYRVDYQPAESSSGLFGGNSNWRGPIWFPMNFLLIEALQKFHHYFGDDFKVDFPTRSGNMLNLAEVAAEISRRLNRIFLRGADGCRPVAGDLEIFQSDPLWRDLILFHEYFHGDSGAGLGANHQTGWTALVAKLLTQSGESYEVKPAWLTKSASKSGDQEGCGANPLGSEGPFIREVPTPPLGRGA